MKFDFDNLQDEDSPYPEVRASVSNIDDPDMPTLTIRMWFVGLLLSFAGRFVLLLISFFSHPTNFFFQWHESIFQLSSTRPNCRSGCPPSHCTPSRKITSLLSPHHHLSSPSSTRRHRILSKSLSVEHQGARSCLHYDQHIRRPRLRYQRRRRRRILLQTPSWLLVQYGSHTGYPDDRFWPCRAMQEVLGLAREHGVATESYDLYIAKHLPCRRG